MYCTILYSICTRKIFYCVILYNIHLHHTVLSNILAVIFLFRNSEQVHQDQPCKLGTPSEVTSELSGKGTRHLKSLTSSTILYWKEITFSLHHHFSFISLFIFFNDVLLVLFLALYRTGQSSIQSFENSLSFSSYWVSSIWHFCPFLLQPFNLFSSFCTLSFQMHFLYMFLHDFLFLYNYFYVQILYFI